MTQGMLSTILAVAAILFLLAPSSSSAFSVQRPASRASALPLFQAADAWSNTETSGGGSGSIEQIEFKIHPDGRVEETVRGVKGGNCHKVTEKINEALGEVVASEPTAEMFEQEVVVEQTLYNKDSGSSSGGGWEGSSSW